MAGIVHSGRSRLLSPLRPGRAVSVVRTRRVRPRRHRSRTMRAGRFLPSEEDPWQPLMTSRSWWRGLLRPRSRLWRPSGKRSRMFRSSSARHVRRPRNNGTRRAWTRIRTGSRRVGRPSGRSTSIWEPNLRCRSRNPRLQAGSGRTRADGAARQLSHHAAAQAERDAVAAVAIARMALTDAALAVLQARLARIQAGEDEPDAEAIDGYTPLHGPALVHGLRGKICGPLRVVVAPAVPCVAGHGVEVPPVLLDFLAVSRLHARQAEGALLEDRIPPVPQRKRARQGRCSTSRNPARPSSRQR